MNVSLTPELEALVRRQVETGQYSSPDQVMREALQLLDEHNRHKRLNAALAIGDEEYRRGEAVPWTPESLDELIREADEEGRQGFRSAMTSSLRLRLTPIRAVAGQRKKIERRVRDPTRRESIRPSSVSSASSSVPS